MKEELTDVVLTEADYEDLFAHLEYLNNFKVAKKMAKMEGLGIKQLLIDDLETQYK